MQAQCKGSDVGIGRDADPPSSRRRLALGRHPEKAGTGKTPSPGQRLGCAYSVLESSISVLLACLEMGEEWRQWCVTM